MLPVGPWQSRPADGLLHGDPGFGPGRRTLQVYLSLGTLTSAQVLTSHHDRSRPVSRRHQVHPHTDIPQWIIHLTG